MNWKTDEDYENYTQLWEMLSVDRECHHVNRFYANSETEAKATARENARNWHRKLVSVYQVAEI